MVRHHEASTLRGSREVCVMPHHEHEASFAEMLRLGKLDRPCQRYLERAGPVPLSPPPPVLSRWQERAS